MDNLNEQSKIGSDQSGHYQINNLTKDIERF